jgi:hypothetical protein
MEKKMVHGLSIPLAHVSLINHNDIPLAKIVHDKDFFSKVADQVKKVTHKGVLVCQILFQEK